MTNWYFLSIVLKGKELLYGTRSSIESLPQFLGLLQVAGGGRTGSLKGLERATRPAIFKWRQTEPVLVLCPVRSCLRYYMSVRDVGELLEERGLQADHTT
jgi:hypothetical protein